MKNNKALNITTGGILIALTLVVLYLTAIISVNTLTLLTIASVFVPIALMRCNLKTAIVVYIGASLLSFLLVPLNISIMYILFFGIYGIIKYLAEKKVKTKFLSSTLVASGSSLVIRPNCSFIIGSISFKVKSFFSSFFLTKSSSNST